MSGDLGAPPSKLGARVSELLLEIVREASRFDSAYDRRIRDLAMQALALQKVIEDG